MINIFKKLFKRRTTPEKSIPEPDFSSIIDTIKVKETSEKIIPGKKIHEFEYRLLTLRLDQDIAENYRITVSRGNERIYSFTVFASQGDYSALEKAYRKIIVFLQGEQKITDLPKSDLIKGFYFGNPSE